MRMRGHCSKTSIGVVVAPGPVFVLLFFLGLLVFVVLAMFFGEETAPCGLFVLVPLPVVTVFLCRGRGRCRCCHHISSERSGQGCGKQKRGEMRFRFVHSGSSGGMKTELLRS